MLFPVASNILTPPGTAYCLRFLTSWLPLHLSHAARVSRVSLLKESGVSQAEVTPRKRRMVLTTRKYQAMAKRLERQVRSLRQDVSGLKKLLSDEKIWIRVRALTSPGVSLLVENEVKNMGKKSKKGWRYDNPEFRALCIAIHRRGPKCYRLLQVLWNLPSERTVKRWLSTVRHPRRRGHQRDGHGAS